MAATICNAVRGAVGHAVVPGVVGGCINAFTCLNRATLVGSLLRLFIRDSKRITSHGSWLLRTYVCYGRDTKSTVLLQNEDAILGPDLLIDQAFGSPALSIRLEEVVKTCPTPTDLIRVRHAMPDVDRRDHSRCGSLIIATFSQANDYRAAGETIAQVLEQQPTVTALGKGIGNNWWASKLFTHQPRSRLLVLVGGGSTFDE